MQAQSETHASAIGSFRDVTGRNQAVENLQRECRALEQRLQSTDHAMQMIAYEIHDGLAQYLAAAMMRFEVFERLADRNSDEAANVLVAGVTMLRRGHAEARRLISKSRTGLIDDIGLDAALSRLVCEQQRAKGPQIACERTGRFERLSSIQKNALYRIAQEALTNACKHSKSNKVMITLTQKGEEVRLKIRDWGIGFDPAAVEKQRFGLESIRERARILGGTCVIQSSLVKGTCITVKLPITSQQQGTQGDLNFDKYQDHCGGTG